MNVSHGDSYTCLVINNAGFGVANTIVYIRPYFIIEPTENVFAQVSTSVNLNCVAESFPEPSKYEWFKLMSGSFVKLEGENTTTLMFASVDFSDFGTYRCEATTDILNVTITSRESVLHGQFRSDIVFITLIYILFCYSVTISISRYSATEYHY